MFNLLKSIFKIPIAAFLTFIMWVAMIMVLGLYDFATATFDWSRVMEPEYLATSGTLAGFGLIIFITTLIRRAQKIRTEDKPTIARNNEIDNMATNLDTSDMAEFVQDENLARRKAAYLEDKDRIRGLWMDKASPEDVDCWASGTDEEKKKNRYCRHMKHLARITEDNYVKDNNRYLKADFVAITPGFLLSGVQRNKSVRREQENPSKAFSIAVADNWLGFLLPTVFIAILLSIQFEKGDIDYVAALISLGWKIVALLIQDMSARFYAPKWNKATYVADVNLRRNLFFKYVDWKVKRSSRLNKPKEAEVWQTNTDSQQTTTVS